MPLDKPLRFSPTEKKLVLAKILLTVVGPITDQSTGRSGPLSRLGSGRMIGSSVYSINGVQFLQTWPHVVLPPDPTDLFRRIRSGEVRRSDIISWLQYGDPLYWWIICLANGWKDPVSQPDSAGVLIRIPDLGTALRIVRSIVGAKVLQ